MNGKSISVWAPEGIDLVEYFHLEFAAHEIIFAEGAAAESLWPRTGNRADDGLDGEERRQTVVAAAPMLGLPGGGRAELGSRLRSALSPLVDRRIPFDRIRDRLDERAEVLFS